MIEKKLLVDLKWEWVRFVSCVDSNIDKIDKFFSFLWFFLD